MIDKVRNTIIKYNMPVEGKKIVVGLSGGSDSMCLINILNLLKTEFNFTLEAAHVNHCIRGEDADNDENFCRQQCENMGIKFNSLKADVITLAKEQKKSVEEAGRDVRYNFFSECTSDNGLIATAHNLDDRIETLLFNFTRGSSLNGLCSIPVINGNIIRPLIECTKDEINAFCKEKNISYVTDKTNSDVKYTRNRIRHNVITELKEINPSFEGVAQRCIDCLNEDESCLHSIADGIVKSSALENGFDISKFSLEPAILKRTISIIISSCSDISPDSRMINDVADIIKNYSKNSSKTPKVQLSGNKFIRIRNNLLEPYDETDISVESLKLQLGNNKFGNYLIITEFIEKESIVKCEDTYYIDYDVIKGDIVIRSRIPEDKICNKSRGLTKFLRKIQNEIKMPPELRDIIPVIADDEGVILAYGCGIDSRACITSNTKKVLKIIIKSAICGDDKDVK